MPDLEENNTMHSVDVTPAVRESVMQGQPKFSLRSDVADILTEYDTEGVKYGSILDVADGIETVIAESVENTSELENILNDFRAAQDDVRKWGNRMDSGGEEEFEKALRAYVENATLGERSDADSHNTSSEGLLSESSERLSVNPLTSPKDGAKIANDTEIIKRSAIKILNEGGIKSDFGQDNLKYVNKEIAMQWLGIAPPEGAASLTDAQQSIANIIQNFENPKIEPKNSLRELDARYIEVVERGDMETEDVAREDQIILREGTKMAMGAKKKSAEETVSPNNSDHPAAISSADGAKILNNLDNLAKSIKKNQIDLTYL